jgi:hypothetical protein
MTIQHRSMGGLSHLRVLHRCRASFDRLRMRKNLHGIEKSLMLSLSKHARRLSQATDRYHTSSNAIPRLFTEGAAPCG